MTVHLGTIAPANALPAWVRGEPEPRTISLDGYRGSWVALFFYPRDFTFVCPTELQALGSLADAFAREGAVLLAASTDSHHCHRAWYESDPRLAGVRFPVLADTAHELSRAFGVLGRDGAALRGTYLIDPEGRIRHIQVNDLSVGRDPEETLRTLRALRTGELCPVAWRPGERTLRAA